MMMMVATGLSPVCASMTLSDMVIGAYSVETSQDFKGLGFIGLIRPLGAGHASGCTAAAYLQHGDAHALARHA